MSLKNKYIFDSDSEISTSESECESVNFEEQNDKHRENKNVKKSKIEPIVTDSKTIQLELTSRQIRNIDPRFDCDDKSIGRLSVRLASSPFHPTACSLWIGQKSNTKKDDGKNAYGTFWINGGKVPSHRVMYLNFIGPLKKKEIVKRSCKNGLCQNINHFYVKRDKEIKTSIKLE